MQRVHSLRDTVKIIIEQTNVHVERHGSRTVTEHLRYSLDVGTGGDCERGGGVAELVRCQTGQTDILGSSIEHIAAEVRVSQQPPMLVREDQVIGSLASDHLGQDLGQELRYWYGPSLVGFWRAPCQPSTDLGHRLGDTYAPAHQIDSLDPQCSCLAPAEPAEGEHVDQCSILLTNVGDRVLRSRVGQLVYLLRCEESFL